MLIIMLMKNFSKSWEKNPKKLQKIVFFENGAKKIMLKF